MTPQHQLVDHNSRPITSDPSEQSILDDQLIVRREQLVRTDLTEIAIAWIGELSEAESAQERAELLDSLSQLTFVANRIPALFSPPGECIDGI